MLLPVRVIKRVVPPDGNFSLDSSTTSSLPDSLLTPSFSIRLLVSIAMGLPLTIYLWRGDKKKPNTSSIGEHHGANQEYAQNAEGNQGKDSNSTASTHDEVRYPFNLLSQRLRCARAHPTNDGVRILVTNLLTCVQPRAMGSSKGPTSMSFKQEGLDNADTMNPYINEPGKSKKGEGETETAKVKGTVKPDRPQV